MMKIRIYAGEISKIPNFLITTSCLLKKKKKKGLCTYIYASDMKGRGGESDSIYSNYT